MSQPPTPMDALKALVAVTAEAIAAGYGPATASLLRTSAQEMVRVIEVALNPPPPEGQDHA